MMLASTTMAVMLMTSIVLLTAVLALLEPVIIYHQEKVPSSRVYMENVREIY